MRASMLRALFGFLLVGVVAGGFLWFFSDDSAPPPSAGGPGVESDGRAGPDSIGVAGDDGVSRALGTDRESLAIATADDLDPVLRAVQTGYEGRIITESGVPVADARVRLFRLALDAAMTAGVTPFSDTVFDPTIEGARATTDVDGRFFLAGIWPRGITYLRVDFERPEDRVADDGTFDPTLLGASTIQLVEAAPAPGTVHDIGDVTLKQGAIVSGRVVDEDGDGIPGATVRSVQMPGTPFEFVPLHRFDPEGGIAITFAGVQAVLKFPSYVLRALEALPLVETRTDLEGRFTLYGVDPGDNVVAATKPGLDPWIDTRMRLNAGDIKDVGDVVLAEGEVGEVLVVDTEGNPQPGVEVWGGPASLGPPAHFVSPAGKTDGEGLTEIAGLPRAGRFVAAARRTASGSMDRCGASDDRRGPRDRDGCQRHASPHRP